MSHILVSVIMPVYNASEYIQEAVDCIRNQTITNWELIIVDDCSTDGSAEKINGLKDARIRLIRLPENRGYPFALVEALKVARGKYIARMDSDDICFPSRLEKQLDALKINPESSMCGINQFRITPGGKRLRKKVVPAEKYVFETWEELMDNRRLFADPSVLVERQKIEHVGGYRTFQKSGMDVDLWLRIVETFGPCVTIAEPLYGKRLEPGSIIFDPRTPLINQVPRALARQRRTAGADDVQTGKGVDIQTYLRNGTIHEGDQQVKMNMLYGALIACVYARDWKGAKAFWDEIRKDGALTSHVSALMSRIINRVNKNPYRMMRSV